MRRRWLIGLVMIIASTIGALTWLRHTMTRSSDGVDFASTESPSMEVPTAMDTKSPPHVQSAARANPRTISASKAAAERAAQAAARINADHQ
jgi:hypothetical protein